MDEPVVVRFQLDDVPMDDVHRIHRLLLKHSLLLRHVAHCPIPRSSQPSLSQPKPGQECYKLLWLGCQLQMTAPI